MLKFLVRYYFRDKIHTDEPELFYKLYKWICGLHILISLRSIIVAITLYAIGFLWIIIIKPRIYGLAFAGVGLLILILEIIGLKKQIKFNAIGMRTPKQIRTIQIQDFIRKYISINGKALGKKEWKVIKNHDIWLYRTLLCDECNHCCYFYSLKIARIIKDSILIWGAIKDPFDEGHKYYAHAIILRNGYIYDSNMRQSAKYEDFVKLYKFKTYKQWNYDEYSQENFRKSERTEFREWCKKNNVLDYEKF